MHLVFVQKNTKKKLDIIVSFMPLFLYFEVCTFLCITLLDMSQRDENDGREEEQQQQPGIGAEAAAAPSGGSRAEQGAGGEGDLVRKEMYLVKWKNLSYLHNSWEMSTHLQVNLRSIRQLAVWGKKKILVGLVFSLITTMPVFSLFFHHGRVIFFFHGSQGM